MYCTLDMHVEVWGTIKSIPPIEASCYVFTNPIHIALKPGRVLVTDRVPHLNVTDLVTFNVTELVTVTKRSSVVLDKLRELI